MFTSSPDNGSGGSRKPAGSPRPARRHSLCSSRSGHSPRHSRRIQLAALSITDALFRSSVAFSSAVGKSAESASREARANISYHSLLSRLSHIVAVVAMVTVQCRLIVAPDGTDGPGELYRTRLEHQPLLEFRSYGRQVPSEPSELAHASQLCPLPKPRRDLAAQGTQALLPLHQLYLREVSTNR